MDLRKISLHNAKDKTSREVEGKAKNMSLKGEKFFVKNGSKLLLDTRMLSSSSLWMTFKKMILFEERAEFKFFS